MTRLVLAVLISLSTVFVAPVLAQTSVTAIALFNDRAMLSVDGKKAKIIRAGKTYLGVKLIRSNTSEAIVEVNGKKKTLVLNSTATLSDELGSFEPTATKPVVKIRVDPMGFFQNSGTVNGKSINFLVDTGASLVVLSSSQAEAIGLDYLDGILGVASTASGNAPMYNIKLDSISLGAIRLKNIQAGVIEGNFPAKPLLGMTFLSKVDMTRSGDLMTLTGK